MAQIHVAQSPTHESSRHKTGSPPSTYVSYLHLLKRTQYILGLGVLFILALCHQHVFGICTVLSIIAGLACSAAIPNVGFLLARAGRVGRDLNKLDLPYLPESLGIVVGTVYLISLFIFLPFPFFQWFVNLKGNVDSAIFPFQKLGEYTAALLSICSMLFLGFADDVLNLKWRHKIFLPALATLPLLMIYSLTFGVTSVVVPLPLRHLFGEIVDLGSLYYLYMSLLAIFCTHSINILAGVNGVEVGQSIVIAVFVLLTNITCIYSGDSVEYHLFSLYLMMPFVAVSIALLRFNWFPAKVFVGDTFCYFSGMLFAVVAILGHFSKTLLLYFIPQTFNFLYSVPQLFGFIPCPRHRLPQINPDTGLLEPSKVTIKRKNISKLGALIIGTSIRLKLAKIYNEAQNEINFSFGSSKSSSESSIDLDPEPSTITMNNFTLLNLLLVWFGPLREDHLTILMLAVQTTSCLIGFLIRHQLARFFFP